MNKSIFFFLILLALITFSCRNATSSSSNNQQIQVSDNQSVTTADTTNLRGFDLRFWHVFTGQKGADAIQLTFYVSENGDIKGHYHYEKDEVKIPIVGKAMGRELTFSASAETKVGDSFKGLMYANDTLKGAWTNAATAQKTDITLRLGSGLGNEDFYHGIYGSPDAIEGFMKQVKTAILNDDTQWLAQHTRFPIKVNVNNKRIEIQNEAALIAQSPDIFTSKFKEKIKAACTLDLFNKHGEAMIANGEIWIANTGNSTENSFDYWVIAINN
jgi:hypothetical protein